LACSLALFALAPVPATAQAPATYEVARGDTLFRIAGKTRPQGATVFQMIVALYRANPDAFVGGNINQLEVGRVLSIPSGESVMSMDAAQAAAEYRALIAKPLSPVPAAPAAPAAKESPAPRPRPEPPAKPSAALTPAQAADRHQQGLQAERSGDTGAAMAAYLAAAESGHGPAQKRLGDIYNTGNALVKRDYETALKWYQKAREQGIEIPRPLTHTPLPPK
jgi:pilus assembly protein FimV